jgi:hypothetical protein
MVECTHNVNQTVRARRGTMPAPRALVWVFVLIAASLPGLARLLPATRVVSAQSPPRYLFTWTGDEDRADSDFLAVIDLHEEGGRYGTIVATAPVGEKGLWPHHTEYELGAGRMLFANGFPANRNFLFDLHEPLRPGVVARFGSVGFRLTLRTAASSSSMSAI